MSDRLIEWNGKTYDVDAAELNMGEFEEIVKRGGPSGLFEMYDDLKNWKPTAWKALFWIQDRRTNPDLSFGDYAGPTYRVVIDGSKKLPDPPTVESGKDAEPSETDGSEPSQTPSDGPQPSSTS